MMEDRPPKRVRNMEQQASCYIGTVGITNGYNMIPIESVCLRSLIDKIMQFMRSEYQILFVENAFR